MGKTTLAELLNATALPSNKHAAFAKALAENTQPLEKFWATLADGQHGFTAQEVAAVRQTLSIGAFVKNTLPLMSALQNGFSAGTYKALPGLAKLSGQDWQELVQQAGPGVLPANIAGRGPARTFARAIYVRVDTAAYPTAALSTRTTSFVPSRLVEPVETFFTYNAALDLRRENLDIYSKNAGAAAFPGISEEDRPGVAGNRRATCNACCE